LEIRLMYEVTTKPLCRFIKACTSTLYTGRVI
jgi:hypothetical protein